MLGGGITHSVEAGSTASDKQHLALPPTPASVLLPNGALARYMAGAAQGEGGQLQGW